MTEPPATGWLEVVRWFVSSPYPLTAFLFVVVLLTSYIAYLIARHFIKRHSALIEGLTQKHKLCEWRIQNVINAMIFHVRSNGNDAESTSSGNLSNHGRRKTDELVGRMLESALAGPQNDAERAEVNAIQL